MTIAVEYFDPDGVTANPSMAYDFGTKAPSTTAARKLWIRNSGDQALSAAFIERLIDSLANGGVGVIKFGLDTVSVRPPYGGAAVIGAAGGGGVFVNGNTWYFKATRVNASGETQGSVQWSYLITDATKQINLSWLLPGGPAGTAVKVYASLTSGVFTTPALISGSLAAGATTYTWNGTTPAAGALPAANTTAGAGPAYGTPPSFVTTDLAVAAMAVGEARALWFNYTLGASPTDVDYLVTLMPIEP
jgi:hypothetical protein